jgi:hypothetical protein
VTRTKEATLKTRLLALAVALGMLAGFGVAAGACTSDGGSALTLEEYFQQLDELDNRSNDQFGELDSQLGEEPDIDAVKEVFPQYVDIVDEFFAGLEDLEPPDEAKDAHDEAIEAGQAFREEFGALVENSGDAETVDEVFAGFESEAFTTADQRFTDACLALQEIADENSITVDLTCGDE